MAINALTITRNDKNVLKITKKAVNNDSITLFVFCVFLGIIVYVNHNDFSAQRFEPESKLP